MKQRFLSFFLAALLAFGGLDAHALRGVSQQSTALTAASIATAEGGEDSLTAFATGGQASATALSASVFNHRVTTVTTAGDSVKLPPATVGLKHCVRNDGANAMQVFGTGSETINGIASGTGFSQPAGTGICYISTTAGAYTTATNYNPASVAVTGGSITGVSGVPVKLSQWGVAVFIAPSGTMGNNGAVTLGTALDRTYAEGVWMYFPAGAVATSTPASATFLWTVCASTTACTVYNSTFNGASVPTAGTTTAYVTTGPGAYTGVTSAVVAITVTVPSNTLGALGKLEGNWGAHHNGAAGNKTFEVLYSTTSGTNYGYVGSTQGSGSVVYTAIRNQTTGIQNGGSVAGYNGGTVASGLKFGTADTTASTTLIFRLTNATATNWMGVVGGSFFTAQ